MTTEPHIPFTLTALCEAQRINGGKGAVVHMRNGGVLEAASFTVRAELEGMILWESNTTVVTWFSDGRKNTAAKTPFDLTHITPTPKRLSGFVNVYAREIDLHVCNTREEADENDVGFRLVCLDLSRLAHENDDGSYTPITEGFGV